MLSNNISKIFLFSKNLFEYRTLTKIIEIYAVIQIYHYNLA